MTTTPGHVRLRPWMRSLGAQAGTALGYLLATQLSSHAAMTHPHMASVWPPAGFALGIVLLVGSRLWPGLALGAVVAALPSVSWPGAIAFAVGCTLAALLGAAGLRRIGFHLCLDRARDAVALIGIGALVSPIISSTIGVAGLHFAGDLPVERVGPIWLRWWTGDAVGILLVTPLMLAWWPGRSAGLPPARRAEVVALAISLVAASAVFLRIPAGYEYALFPLVGWAAIRLGPRGASAATALVAAIAIWHAVQGIGPFATSPQDDSLLRLRVFLGLLATASLVMAAMSMEQRRAAGALRSSELRFQRIFEHAGVGIGVVGPDGRIAVANPALQQMLGFSAAELAERTIADVTHAEDLREEEPLLADVLAGRRTNYRMVKRYRRKDGTVFWGRLTAIFMPRGGGGGALRERL
ncbi:MAG: MASE1 domain-containing protein, partial [Gemmatimonadota bacterium]